MSELYLVTGAAGHLGSTVVRKLLELEKNIRILVLPNEKNIPKARLTCAMEMCASKKILLLF